MRDQMRSFIGLFICETYLKKLLSDSDEIS